MAVALSCILVPFLTRGFWIPRVAESLVCPQQIAAADAILVENFDLNYLVFERSAELRRDGVAPRALVLTQADAHDRQLPNLVSVGIVDVLARVARLQDFVVIPIVEVEPITLNAARQLRDYALRNSIRSIVVVAPAFRSKRSVLVYESVLGPAGVTVTCIPVFGGTTPKTWAASWHGVQGVVEQFLKLQYLPVLCFAVPVVSCCILVLAHGQGRRRSRLSEKRLRRA